MSNTLNKKTDKNSGEYVTLDNAELGAVYVITECNLPDKLQLRFAELGFVVGARVTAIKAAPLRDPIEIRIMDYSVCVRANELKHFKAVRTDDE